MFAAACMAVAGCASAPEELITDKELYDEAVQLRDKADYEGAAEKFDELVATYPASRYAQQGMLDVSYLYYQRGEYASALSAADRFIEAYPGNSGIPYAMYLKGLAYFREDQNLIDRLGIQNPAERNPETMRLAFFTFKRLVEEHPGTTYAEDAAQRMRYLINALAEGEIYVARYYLRRGAPLAAAGRAQQVLKDYPDSRVTEDALMIMYGAYEQMGAADELQKTRRLLKANFPENPLLGAKAENSEESAPPEDS